MKLSVLAKQAGARLKLVSLTAASGALLVAALQAAAAEPMPQFKHDISLAEIMESHVMPAANDLWSSVSVNMTLKGEEIEQPETDEEWTNLRWSAVRLADATNLLLIPDTPVVPDPIRLPVGEGELKPEQIAALQKKEWPAWTAHVFALHQIAMQMVKAVDNKDTKAISDLGGTLDEACESCHLQFWYPDQQKYLNQNQ